MLEGTSEETIKKLDMVEFLLVMIKCSNCFLQILASLALLKESSDVEEVAATCTAKLQEVSSEDVTVNKKEDTLPAGWGTTVAARISTGVDVVSRTVEKGTELANKAIVMVNTLSW